MFRGLRASFLLSSPQGLLPGHSGTSSEPETLSFRLKFRHDDLPGLRELLEERREEWCETFPAEFAAPPYPMVSTNLGYDVPMPEVGDTAMLADIVGRVERMAGAMVPLVTVYFARRQPGDA